MYLGEILREAGLISDPQIDELVRMNRQTGEPFGQLAQRVLGIAREDIEQAWAAYMSSLLVPADLSEFERVEPTLLARFDPDELKTLNAVPLAIDENETLHAAIGPGQVRSAMVYFWRNWMGRMRFYLANPRQISSLLGRIGSGGGRSAVGLS